MELPVAALEAAPAVVVSRVTEADLLDFAPGAGLAADAAGAYRPPGEWLSVPLPGDVHTALVAAGRIRHPFDDRKELDCAWVEDREWWYRFPLTGPDDLAAGERLRLVLHGLDTYATIWLNGTELGRHRTMFRPAVFDVTDRLRPGAANVVAIRFAPPLREVPPDDPALWAMINKERLWMRKAQYGYGWDWGPRLPTVGVWRPVELRHERQATLTDVHCATVSIDPEAAAALLRVKVRADLLTPGIDLAVQVTLTEPDTGRVVATAEPALLDGRATAYLTVDRPRLWWTHDLGEPTRYELAVTISSGGHALDRAERRIGIRTIELDQSPDPDEPGTRFFRFVLNGTAIFARGANWIPAESFPGAVPNGRYGQLLTAARDANMNMIRVWGGGIYEHGAFYETCDELGILVWQDFMFACAAYPDHDPAFVEEVRREAEYQVTRLRNHACLALWCGNNENQWLHDVQFWERGGEKVPGTRLYDEVLPEVCGRLDPATPYWPGSPYGGNDHNSRAEGDVHNWDVWHGNSPRRFGERPHHELSPAQVAFTRYAEDDGRFISEFGVLSAPDPVTLERVLPPDQRRLGSPGLEHHIKDTPKDKVNNLLASVTGLPADYDELLRFTSTAHAEAMKFALEHYRRRRPHCSGALIWQLNDVWPGFSWSLVDYYGFRKAAYWATRRAFNPVAASFRATTDGGVELWVVNDTPKPFVDDMQVTHADFTGVVRWSHVVPVSVAALSSVLVHTWSAGDLMADAAHYLWVRAAGGGLPDNRHFFAAIKDLRLPAPEISCQARELPDGSLSIEVRSLGGYARAVTVSSRDEGVRFDDNAFDLPAGALRTVMARHDSRRLVSSDIQVRASV